MELNGDGGKRIAILEMGWTSDPRPDSPYRWHAVSDAEEADYLALAVQYGREHWKPCGGADRGSPGFAPLVVRTLPVPAWKADQEQTYGPIPGPSGTPRPAYDALK